ESARHDHRPDVTAQLGPLTGGDVVVLPRSVSQRPHVANGEADQHQHGPESEAGDDEIHAPLPVPVAVELPRRRPNPPASRHGHPPRASLRQLDTIGGNSSLFGWPDASFRLPIPDLSSPRHFRGRRFSATIADRPDRHASSTLKGHPMTARTRPLKLGLYIPNGD